MQDVETWVGLRPPELPNLTGKSIGKSADTEAGSQNFYANQRLYALGH